MAGLFGRKFKAGWGFNARNTSFIPNVKINGLLTKPRNCYPWSATRVFDINRYMLSGLFSIDAGEFIESIINKNQSVYKWMDFLIENHETSGFISRVVCYSETTTAKKSDNYPPETTHFVDRVEYGLGMYIIFDKKNNHLFESDEKGDFLNEIWGKGKELTEEQKNIVYSVLIFSIDPEKTEMKKMTMNEIVKLLDDFKNGKLLDREIPFDCDLKRLTDNSYFLDDNRSDPRWKILENQFFDIYWFKKILENKATMPKFFKDASAFKNIYPKIKNGKNSNFWLEKMGNLWNLKIGHCLKIIRGSRITELELSLDSFFDDLEKTAEESQIELKSGQIVQNVESNDETQTIILNKKDLYLLDSDMINQLKVNILLKNGEFEPNVEIDDPERKILLGFASHQNKFTNTKLECSELFVTDCPENCSDDLRHWICTTCGEFFKSQNSKVTCGCGTTHIMNLKSECFDPKHPKTFSFWQNYVDRSPEKAKITTEQKTAFKMIKQQFEKKIKTSNLEENEMMKFLLNLIENPDVAIVDQLKSFTFENLDGDTKNLIQKL